MATEKQRKAVDNMVENGGNVSKAMRDAKYSKETAKTPKKLTDSIGYKEIMEEKGFTEGYVIEELMYDIDMLKGSKTNARRGHLELASKILGMGKEKLEVEHTGSISLSQLFENAQNDPVSEDSE